MRPTFLTLALLGSALAQDAGKSLIQLTDLDPKGSACGAYFRLESGKIIYHIQSEEKASSQPVDYVAKIVEDDRVGVPSVISKPLADGALLTIVMSATERKAATCLPATIYVEKRQ